MNKLITKTETDLDKAILTIGDYNPNLNFCTLNEGRLYTIFGCTHLSEAYRFVSDDTCLFITDDADLAEKVLKSGEDGYKLKMDISYFVDEKIAHNHTLNEEAYNVTDENQAACVWGTDISKVTVF